MFSLRIFDPGEPGGDLELSMIYSIGSYHFEVTQMDTAKIFSTGRSQAIRLPKKYRFAGREVVVRHFGNGVLLLPLDEPWEVMKEALTEFEAGFTLEREQPPTQSRAKVEAE
jgi:antitoxin VapB